MQKAVPNYYHKFTCIADRCRHSCCIGWEIDIDEKTMAMYQTMALPIGEDIRNSIEGDEPHFKLQSGDRCPFLKDNGLCRIICECGKDALCDICRLHPRFRNFYSSFVETGLGLCCEEAARIILFDNEPFSILLPDDVELTEEEQLFFSLREQIFEKLKDRTKSIEKRFLMLKERYRISFDFSLRETCEYFLSLERLEESWTKRLLHLKEYKFDESVFKDSEFSVLFENLAVYFVFRHLSDGLWDGLYAERLRLAFVSCYLIGAFVSQIKDEKGVLEDEDIIDIVRQYSSEIEYSEENIFALLKNQF